MLRVFLPAPPIAARADAWVRYADDGRPVARGRDAPDAWPPDPAIEAVVAAAHVRLAALDLPPMPGNRLRAAARFALEDQMASTAAEAAVAVAAARNGGPAIAAVASDALIRAIAGHTKRIARIIPESALAPHTDGWTWCMSAAGGGFVRRADGSTFAIGGADGANEVPPELAAALAQATRGGAAPPVVHAAVRSTAAQLAQWSQTTGIRFVAAPEWHWERATAGAFAAAPDFLADDTQPAASQRRPDAMRWFRPALVLAALAILIHLGALITQWAWLRVDNWQLARALVEQAGAAQLPDAATPEAATAAIARRNAELRHRASQSAPADALPLLARAAPSIGALPPGMLKSAAYAGNAWTLELGKLDPAAASSVTRALARNGVDALAAPTAGGTRMRLTLDATAR